MVECESTLMQTSFLVHIVLIDTWWNVNIHALVQKLKVQQVLIDTWWNVNNGINSMGLQVQSVLIDTWWNVNWQKTV